MCNKAANGIDCHIVINNHNPRIMEEPSLTFLDEEEEEPPMGLPSATAEDKEPPMGQPSATAADQDDSDKEEEADKDDSEPTDIETTTENKSDGEKKKLEAAALKK